ncbi:MAG: hypothetical protein ACJAS4_000960 [Bacteriovoracaceae bacterium]|jgi:hypothetical protein
MKYLVLFLFQFLSQSCNSEVVAESLSEKTIGDSEKVELLGMVVNNITQSSFDVEISYSNDINLNSVGTLYFCNETSGPSCDPFTGDSKITLRSKNKFKVSLTSLGALSYSPGDVLNITFEVVDVDGYLSFTKFDSQVNLAP